MTVPDGWSASTLGQIGRYLNGRGFKKSEWRTGGRPIIRIQNLTGSNSNFNYFQGDLEDRYIVRPGDLLVSWAATLGAYFWNGPEAALNQHIFKVESVIDVRFHKYLLDYKLAELMTHTHGSGMVHITRGKFDNLPVSIPGRDEQRRIVDLLEDHLSRLDVSAAYFNASERRLGALERSALDREFGGCEVPLSELVASISAGKSFGATNSPAAPDQWGIIKVSAMTWGEFRSDQNKAVPAERVDPRFEIREGDLLVSRANTSDYVGASVMVGPVRPRLLLSDKSLRIRPHDGVSVEWLWRALQAPSARKQVSALATGTKDSMRNISQGALLGVRVPDPGSTDQASAIAAFNRVRDSGELLRRELTQSVERLAALRRSLLSAAFSGRLTADASALRMVGA